MLDAVDLTQLTLTAGRKANLHTSIGKNHFGTRFLWPVKNLKTIDNKCLLDLSFLRAPSIPSNVTS